MEIPTDKTFERLSRIFDNPDLGGEDWDLIFADPDRVSEFCDVYEQGSLNANEKTALMQLIVASYDRYLDKATYTKLLRKMRSRSTVKLLRHNELREFYNLSLVCNLVLS